VKSFATISNSQVELKMIHSIRHNHIVSVLEIFRFENSFYVVLERMTISLVQIVASSPYPNEQELVAILG
jgi:serine/threonine protein kinase